MRKSQIDNAEVMQVPIQQDRMNRATTIVFTEHCWWRAGIRAALSLVCSPQMGRRSSAGSGVLNKTVSKDCATASGNELTQNHFTGSNSAREFPMSYDEILQLAIKDRMVNSLAKQWSIPQPTLDKYARGER